MFSHVSASSGGWVSLVPSPFCGMGMLDSRSLLGESGKFKGGCVQMGWMCKGVGCV